jgi:spore germination protein KA
MTGLRKMANKLLTETLQENITLFKELLKYDGTVVYRDILNRHSRSFAACLVYVDGMADASVTNTQIIQPLMSFDPELYKTGSLLAEELKNKVIFANNIQTSATVDELMLSLFSGNAILLIDGSDVALSIHCADLKNRAITEPGLEKVLRGPKEGFTESLAINISLVRRRLKTQDLSLKFMEIGVRTKTRVCICYLDSLADDRILKELEGRLNRIDIDGILDSGYIQELIKDSPLSPLKTVGNTERPDVVTARLLEGRIAVMVDGSPAALTLPFVFIEYFQAAEDYYNNYYFASINRLIRVLGEIFTTCVPAIYVALITFHQEMIPTPLIVSISAARQDVPFPTILEAILLLLAFEVIREAGMRMPSPLGQSVSIVGALIIGQASVEARIFSAPMVIVVAATGITGLLTLKIKGFSILVRFLLLFLAAFMGLYGLIFGIIGLFIYLFSMRSFGVPYMQEVGSLHSVDLKDTAVRMPWWQMRLRPKQISSKNVVREADSRAKGRQAGK